MTDERTGNEEEIVRLLNWNYRKCSYISDLNSRIIMFLCSNNEEFSCGSEKFYLSAIINGYLHSFILTRKQLTIFNFLKWKTICNSTNTPLWVELNWFTFLSNELKWQDRSFLIKKTVNRHWTFLTSICRNPEDE